MFDRTADGRELMCRAIVDDAPAESVAIVRRGPSLAWPARGRWIAWPKRSLGGLTPAAYAHPADQGRNAMMHVDLVILDELGYLPFAAGGSAWLKNNYARPRAVGRRLIIPSCLALMPALIRTRVAPRRGRGPQDCHA